MNLRIYTAGVAILGAMFFALPLHSEEVDGSDVLRQARERDERVGKLSLEDQLKLRAAEQTAAQDPGVLAALEKRNQALREFRATLRAAMLKADPSIAKILDQVKIDQGQPTGQKAE